MNEQQSIGMMQGAFFVPKSDLLAWVNSTLALQITKIQQLGTGAVYCQLIDAMFPGKVAMQRVNWKARNQWQFINNYKILQQAFAKCKIQKYIDIEKLSKSKYQDNLQFIQWMKRYCDLRTKGSLQYDPVAARKNAQVDFSFVQMRNPLKNREQKMEKEHYSLNKQSLRNLRKSKSPYENIQSKVHNKSLKVGKSKKQVDYLRQRLMMIKSILKNGKNKDQKLQKIKQIIDEAQQQMTNDIKQNESQLLNAKMDKVQSKKIINKQKRQKNQTKE